MENKYQAACIGGPLEGKDIPVLEYLAHFFYYDRAIMSLFHNGTSFVIHCMLDTIRHKETFMYHEREIQLIDDYDTYTEVSLEDLKRYANREITFKEILQNKNNKSILATYQNSESGSTYYNLDIGILHQIENTSPSDDSYFDPLYFSYREIRECKYQEVIDLFLPLEPK